METFNYHITEIEDGKEKCALKEEVVEAVLAKVTLKGFRNDPSCHAYRHQVLGYMRYQLYFTTTHFETFFTD